MTLTTFSVGAAVTPTVVKTCVAHYANRKPRHKKPTAHISYDEGLHLIRCFLQYASHKTVDELQAFTAQWVPNPTWVKTEDVTIAPEHVSKAAETLIRQLGPEGIQAVGGREWWQWRRNGSDLRAEWIEMSAHYNERKRDNKKCRRVMLYAHGGGYFFGSVDEHRYQLQRHARKLKARVIAPRYRLAPQFPFPCGLQDCLAVYLYTLTLHEPNEIILAGDSAGGGMVMSMLCILRDQGLPLPAGAVLISPWVDLTHSFPSVSETNPLDYIPPHGFHHRPSVAWPPPTDDEMEFMRKNDEGQTREEAFTAKATELAEDLGMDTADSNDPTSKVANRVPAPNHFLSIELDNKLVVVKEQIQMYTTNQLLSHPLVSPVLQPSLGGLPPLLILVGGGEMLRDEQIYLGHKAANPGKYPLSDIYKTKYDPDNAILNRYKPTHVQLQVWEDLCHVAPTLSFTRPAKFMYRSIAQFGAWALARAQDRPIEIVDDDEISIISSDSDDETPSDSTDSIARMKNKGKQHKYVGRAGDPLPIFRNHMIRQQVDRYGNIAELPPPEELPATSMDRDEVGLIKSGPVKKWMQAKDHWASKYASTKRKLQKQRIAAIRSNNHVPFGPGERPPPSALAARRTAREVEKQQRKSYGLFMWSMWGSKHDEATIRREDEFVRRETEAQIPAPDQPATTNPAIPPASTDVTSPTIQEPFPPVSPSTRPRRSSRRSLSRGSKQRRRTSDHGTTDRSRSRRRTVSVTDRGQAGALMEELMPPALPTVHSSNHQNNDLETTAANDNDNILITPPQTANPDASNPHPSSPSSNYLSPQSATNAPPFLPKYRTASHLYSDPQSRDVDSMSTRTGFSGISTSNASTRAVFSAPGVSKVATSDNNNTASRPSNDDDSLTASTAQDNDPRPSATARMSNDGGSITGGSGGGSATPTAPMFEAHKSGPVTRGMSRDGHVEDQIQSEDRAGVADGAGAESPVSRRSIERLRSTDREPGDMTPLRRSSTDAVMRVEGVVGVVDDVGGESASESESEEARSGVDADGGVGAGKGKGKGKGTGENLQV